MNNITIIDAYNSYIDKLIIFITSLPECGINKYIKRVANDLNLDYINQIDFFNTDYHIKNDTQYDNKINRYTYDAIDYKKINNAIQHSKRGIIVYGFNLNSSYLIKPSLHIHINISKNICMNNRIHKIDKKYSKSNKINEIKQFDKYKFNNWIYPFVADGIKNTTIHKFIKMNEEMNHEQFMDNLFNIIIEFVTSKTNKL